MTETTGLVVKTISSLDDFIALKPQWDALVDSVENPLIFFTHDWLRIWIESFIPEKPLYIILVYEESRLIGILPLYKETFVTLKFFRRTCLHSLTNSCSVVSGVITRMADMPRVLDAILLHLGQEQGRFSSIILEFVPEDLGVIQLLEERGNRGWAQACLNPWEGSYYVHIDGDYDSYMKGLNKSFRKSMRQKGNWLEQEGGGRCEIFHGYDPEAFQSFLDLEDTGWKQERGRPIKSCPKSTDFFRRVAETFGPKGQFIMMVFHIGNKPACMEYSVLSNGTCYALKNAVNYAEANFARLSPGHMSVQELLKHCFEKKLRRLDFYGYCYPYEAHWTKKINRKYEIMIIKRSDLLMRARIALKNHSKERSASINVRGQGEAAKTV